MNKSSRYERRAGVSMAEKLTTTGTVRISFQVIDRQPFSFTPRNFVGIDCALPALGYRLYIFSPPNKERTFQYLIRVAPEGLVSNFLASSERRRHH